MESSHLMHNSQFITSLVKSSQECLFSTSLALRFLEDSLVACSQTHFIKLTLNNISIYLCNDHQTISASEKKKCTTHSVKNSVKITVKYVVEFTVTITAEF